MTLPYVRACYSVPAKRGGRIRFEHPDFGEGTILSADHHLIVRFDNGLRGRLHPTWHVTYLPETP